MFSRHREAEPAFFDGIAEMFIHADAAGVDLSATRAEDPDAFVGQRRDRCGLEGHGEPSAAVGTMDGREFGFCARSHQADDADGNELPVIDGAKKAAPGFPQFEYVGLVAVRHGCRWRVRVVGVVHGSSAVT